MDLVQTLQTIEREQENNNVLGDIIEAKRLMADPSYEPHTLKAQNLYQKALNSSQNGSAPDIKEHVEEYEELLFERKPEFVHHYVEKAYAETSDLKWIKLGTLPSLEYAQDFVDQRSQKDFTIEKMALEAHLEINAMTLEAMTPFAYQLHELKHSNNGCYSPFSTYPTIPLVEIKSAEKLGWQIPEMKAREDCIGGRIYSYKDEELNEITSKDSFSSRPGHEVKC